jgi:hypothetical protein
MISAAEARRRARRVVVKHLKDAGVEKINRLTSTEKALLTNIAEEILRANAGDL